MVLKGLLFWGAAVLAISALGYALYRYLSSVARYEGRKREIALGAASIVLTSASVLFLPVFLCGAGGSVAGIADSIQKSIAEAAGESLMKDGDGLCRSAVGSLVENHSPAKTADGGGDAGRDGAESAVRFAVRELSRGESLRKALDSAAADLQNSGLMDAVPEAELGRELDGIVSEMFRPYGEEAKRAFREGPRMDPLMGRMFGSVAEATPFEDVTGVPDSAGAWRALESGGRISRLLPKFFIAAGAALALSCVAFFAVVLLCLREPEGVRTREFGKKHIFEYQNQIFDEMNREKR